MARTLLILTVTGLCVIGLGVVVHQCASPTLLGQVPPRAPSATAGDARPVASATAGDELGAAAARLGAAIGAGGTADAQEEQEDVALLPASEPSDAAIDSPGIARCLRDFEETLADLEVLFANASTSIESESREALRTFAEVAARCPRAKIAIEGHTDTVGGDDQNLDLSHARARAVEAFLVAQGVPPARLSARGRGAAEPIADNASAEGRARNRRIEIVVE